MCREKRYNQNQQSEERKVSKHAIIKWSLPANVREVLQPGDSSAQGRCSSAPVLLRPGDSSAQGRCSSASVSMGAQDSSAQGRCSSASVLCGPAGYSTAGSLNIDENRRHYHKEKIRLCQQKLVSHQSQSDWSETEVSFPVDLEEGFPGAWKCTKVVSYTSSWPFAPDCILTSRRRALTLIMHKNGVSAL